MVCIEAPLEGGALSLAKLADIVPQAAGAFHEKSGKITEK